MDTSRSSGSSGSTGSSGSSGSSESSSTSKENETKDDTTLGDVPSPSKETDADATTDAADADQKVPDTARSSGSTASSASSNSSGSSNSSSNSSNSSDSSASSGSSKTTAGPKLLGAAAEAARKEMGEMQMYKKLVERTLFLYPPKPEPKVDLRRIPIEDRPKMRRLARMLHRTGLDQRHVFHDPRSGHSAKQILGPGSEHLFKQMVIRQGRKAVQAKELTKEELEATKQYKKDHKTKVKLSRPSEVTANEILPSVIPLGFSDDSDFDEDDSTDSDDEENGGSKKAESLYLRVSRRKSIRHGRKPPPKIWNTEQDDEPRMNNYPGAVALPSVDPSRGMKKFYNYNGRWRNGKPHGFGKFVFVTATKDNNGIYEGDNENGRPHGIGTRYFRNGCKYEGKFVDGMMDGVGILKDKKDRVFYEGEFKEGLRHGKGRFNTKSGIVYEGMWVKGKREGHGRETNKRGTKYIGMYEDDRIVGPGVIDLKKTDEIMEYHTQHFMRGEWYGYRFPETISELRDEIMDARDYEIEEKRKLTKHIDELALNRFVNEARDLIKEEKQREFEELADAKRKELNDRREALQAKREEMLNSLKAEVGGNLGDDSDEEDEED